MNMVREVMVPLSAALLEAVAGTELSPGRAILEAAVLEFYREARLSSGAAAEALGYDRYDFVRLAAQRGIAFIGEPDEDIEDELKILRQLPGSPAPTP